MNKPREWNIQLKHNKVLGSSGVYMDAENVHVIEYAAYEKLQQENAKLKQACEVMQEALEKSLKLCDDPISTGDVHTA